MRNLVDALTPFNQVSQSAMHTYMRVLAFYRPRELGQFSRKYREDWSGAFKRIPLAKITPPPPRKR